MNNIGYRIYLITGKRGWLAVNHPIKHLFINHLPTFLYLNMISVCVSWGILQVFYIPFSAVRIESTVDQNFL